MLGNTKIYSVPKNELYYKNICIYLLTRIWVKKNLLKNHRIIYVSRCVIKTAQTSKGGYFHFIFIFHFVKIVCTI